MSKAEYRLRQESTLSHGRDRLSEGWFPLLYGLNFLLGQYRTMLNQFAVVDPAAAVHAIIHKLLEGDIQINTQLDGVYHRDLLQAVIAVAAAWVDI